MAFSTPLTTFVLTGGVKLPAVGLGTFQGEAGNLQVKEVVAKALKMGYRHIDGAAAYGNEREIGEGIRDSTIPREEIFVTSKLYVIYKRHAYAIANRSQVSELAQSRRCR